MLTAARVTTLALAISTASAAVAGGGVTWTFDESTDGEDVFWTSPTSVVTDAPRYDIAYELTLVEVTVRYLFLTLDVDVTGDIPPELRMGSAIVDGPPPIVLFQGELEFPGPPDPPALAADIDLQIDAAGFGQLSIINLIFGELEVEIPPFGLQIVQIEGIRVAGQVDVTPLGPAEDVNGDGAINFEDLLALLAAWGMCPDPPETCPADIDGDGMVGFSDILRVLAAWS